MGIKAILLDLDGVLVDFIGGIHKKLGLPYDHTRYHYAHGKYRMLEDIAFYSAGKVTKGEVYAAADCSCFWENLEWHKEGFGILEAAIATNAPIYVCTAPMLRPGAWSGKAKWVSENLGNKVNGLCVTTMPKRLLAQPGHVLIDDCDRNVDEFVQHGGSAFLVPRPWNSKYRECETNWLPELEKFLGSV